MAETVAYKYRAFISYSHADTSWAKWLHRGLEGFRIDKDLVGRKTATGAIPKSLRPIFRDRDDFTAGHTLTDQTLAALDASHALIVICSPASAKSAYVTEEIRLFKSRHPERPVIPLIVNGKPGDPELECFPPSLRFKLDEDEQITDEPIEVLAADAREEGDGKHLALAKFVAGLLGVSSDDIYRRAEHERRRKGRVRNGNAAVIAALVLGGGFFAWQAQQHQPRLSNAFEILGRSPDVYDAARAFLRASAPEEAEALLEINLDEKRKLAAEENKEAMEAYRQRGDVLVAQGDLALAMKAYEDSLAFAESLAKVIDPGNAKWQHHLAVSHGRVAILQAQQGDATQALDRYKQGREIIAQLKERSPDDVTLSSDLAWFDAEIAKLEEAQIPEPGTEQPEQAVW